MSETIIDRARDMHASYGNGGANAPSSALYSTAAAFSNPTTLTPLSVPTHMQHVPSYSNLLSVSGTFSDTDTESDDFKTSPSSGIEADVDRLSPLYDDFDALIGAQEAACTRGCSTHLQGYIEDLELITHAASKDLRAVTGLKLSSTTPEPQETTLQRWKRLSWPLVVFLIIGVVMVLMGRGHLLELLKWMERMPWLESIFVFAVLFTLVSFPFGFGYIILNMMAGYLYGFFRGQIIVMLSVSIGFSVAFILCRSWLKDYARGIVNSNALQAVLRVVEGPHGFKVILLTRFTPIPFGLQNVLFAMTRVSYPVCLCASVCGLLPTQMLNTYMGSTVRNMQEVLSDRVDGYIILSAQVIISIFLMLYLLRKARGELAKLTQQVDAESGNPSNR